MATPIHVHTHASALDGMAKPSEIAERVGDLNMSSCACTDHDIVAGHLSFYQTLEETGIKPLLGIETYQTIDSRFTNRGHRRDPVTKEKSDNFHLILLAMNDKGLRNLWAMNSESHRTGFYYNGRVDWDLLEKFNEGIIATSACGSGMLPQALGGNSLLGDPDILLQKYLNIFGDRFYLELSTYTEAWQMDLNEMLVKLAQDYSVPVVYANDAHYAFPGQYELHEAVLCMQYQQKISQTEPHHTPDLYIMGEDEINAALFYLPQNVVDEAIDNSDDIAYKCNVSLPEQRMRIPVFIPEYGTYKNSKDMLYDLAVKGYKKKIVDFDKDSDECFQRFEKEIKIIRQAGLDDYFLIVRDFIYWAKNQGYLVGPGRGSVGGSLIAYLLGITEIDPIKYDLIFERFYNAGRAKSLPDIDTDFPTFGRDAVKKYLMEKYGENYVADIGTATTLQPRAAIQKLGKVMEVPDPDIRAICRIIDKAIESGLQPSWEMLYEKCGAELSTYKKILYPQLFEWAEALHKNTFTYGVHPSGLLISDELIDENFPVRWHAKEKKVVTQWDMREAEDLGFMKMDLLGLRNLDTLMELNKLLENTGKTPIDFYEVQYMDHPEEMYKLLEEGFTVGIFQIEDGKKAKELCRSIKPRNIEDLAVITALNRPGPLIAGIDHRYLRGRNFIGIEDTTVYGIHPLVNKATEGTYGEFIYQEQVLKFLSLIGYSLEEADDVRKAMGKKKREEMKNERDRFMNYAMKHMYEDLAADIWIDIVNFSKYAFNKSHSIAYGIILLWTLYAKWMHPQEFYLASLKTLGKEGKKNEQPRYVKEAKRMGISVLRPDINRSQAETSIDDGQIRYGFNDVKGIGITPAKWLVNNRPFVNFEDIILRASADENKITLRNGLRKMAIHRGQVESLRRLAELTGEDLVNAEDELLGIVLSDDTARILDDWADEIAAECDPWTDLDQPGTYSIAGVITEIKEAKTRNGQAMAWVTIENEGQAYDFTVWSQELTRLQFVFSRRQALIARVKVTERGMNITGAKPLYAKEINA